MSYCKLILTLSMLLLMSCATTSIYQIDGMPVQDNFVRAKVFDPELIVKYQLIKFFNVVEDDEEYEFHEFVPLNNRIHKFQKVTRLVFDVSIFNPTKKIYKIITVTTVEGGGKSREEVMYDGNLSRKTLEIVLPSYHKNKLVKFYLEIRNKNDNLVFRSFDTNFIVRG